jgi:hypothetical protein
MAHNRPGLSAIYPYPPSRSSSKPVECIRHTIQVGVVEIRMSVRVTTIDAWPITLTSRRASRRRLNHEASIETRTASLDVASVATCLYGVANSQKEIGETWPTMLLLRRCSTSS